MKPERRITLAAVQLPAASAGASDAERQAFNFGQASEWLDQAGRRGAAVACLGETFNVMGITLTPESAAPLVRDATARALDCFAPIARCHRMVIIAPVLTVEAGNLRNTALVIDPERGLVGRYDKVHCIENERVYGVVPGDSWPVFDLGGARIGIQICHDNSFPESARCLALNGSEIIFWPHVMGGWGGEFMDILLRSPAIHNGVYHVPVCFGCPPGRAWRPGMLIGRSSIIAPDATICADAGRHPGIALATVDLAAPRIAADFTRSGDFVWQIDMLNDRRPDAYGPIQRDVVRRPPIPAGTPAGDYPP